MQRLRDCRLKGHLLMQHGEQSHTLSATSLSPWKLRAWLESLSPLLPPLFLSDTLFICSSIHAKLSVWGSGWVQVNYEKDRHRESGQAVTGPAKPPLSPITVQPENLPWPTGAAINTAVRRFRKPLWVSPVTWHSPWHHCILTASQWHHNEFTPRQRSMKYPASLRTQLWRNTKGWKSYLSCWR